MSRAARSFAALLLLAALAAALPAAPAGAAASDALFRNKADGKAFRAKLKRDPFAPPKGIVVVAPPPVERTLEVEVERPATPVESFRVTGIIRVGERGCAVINERTWYLGRPNLGYELVKIEDERVEIKTPDGRLISSELIRDRAPAADFGADAAP